MINFGECKFTEVYSPEVKPVRPGVYLTDNIAYPMGERMWIFQYWNGEYWGKCTWGDDWSQYKTDKVVDIKNVAKYVVEYYNRDHRPSIYQDNYWCGITNPDEV